MNTDLVKRPEIVDYDTGEIVDPRDTERVADLLERLQIVKREQLQPMINLCQEVILETMTEHGTGTLRAGEFEAKRSGGPEIEWDIEELEKLLDVGLPEERYAELVKIVQTFKVDGRIAKQLAGANQLYAEVIERAKQKIEKPYRVSVKRK